MARWSTPRSGAFASVAVPSAPAGSGAAWSMAGAAPECEVVSDCSSAPQPARAAAAINAVALIRAV
jgi:hypothetical protein